MPSLTRLARRLVPGAWRETVERDLIDEAARRGLHGSSAQLWVASHLVRVGLAFRWRSVSGAHAVGRRGPDRWLVAARHTWRTLRARPGGSSGTIAVLTIGVGLATIIFALTDPFLLRPLPYRDPERLVIMRIEPASAASSFEAPRITVGPDIPTLAEWQARSDLFEDVAAYAVWDRVRLATAQGAASLGVWTVSPNFLTMLGGHRETLTPTQPAPPGAPRPLVVTATTAQIRLGLEDEVATTLRAEWRRDRRDSLATVVPAMAEEFLFPSTTLALWPDAVAPIVFSTVAWQSGNSQGWLTGLARLQPGVSPQRVKATLDPRIASSGLQLVVEPLATHLTATFRPLALGALAAGLLIAIACLANVMNLQVARGVYRSRDFATCRALGASGTDLGRLIGLEMTAIAVVEQVDSAHGRLAHSVRDRTFAALVLSLFAAAGVGVTGAGIFAVVAFVVARRTREIAIHVALGAKPGDVRRLVIGDAVLATVAGGAAGLAASRCLGRAIESQLYGLTAEDWTTSVLAIAVLVGVTALAAWWPAKRALAVQPTVALRVE